MSSASFVKRLEQLEKAIRLKQPRLLVVLVDGSTENEPELLETLAVQPDDLVVCIKQFGSVEGLPRLVSIT